jgi:hypothetical protein
MVGAESIVTRVAQARAEGRRRRPMKVRVWAKTDKVGSRVKSEIDVDADATDEEIEENAMRELFERLIDWGWEKDH